MKFFWVFLAPFSLVVLLVASPSAEAATRPVPEAPQPRQRCRQTPSLAHDQTIPSPSRMFHLPSRTFHQSTRNRLP